ncbi:MULTISPECIES: cellulase family glycosylhydrolase [unclassified Lentimonas]|uniref:cellulase family glycosylhydrolase n=1 Tax=unclassified Lentimonas TaxID=2630993 RepID=UPI00132756C8|nr:MULTISPECIES: cellulase family glycosylhydrolase [unclassified Lentimonas]CAA6689470.1 Unannotated [Lentimonas sp. CC10]CAA6692011.1 Unannotated [Lentimonas sp. CC19]CAA7070530.1 Unannotated [Lentimonas sp. CC11]
MYRKKFPLTRIAGLLSCLAITTASLSATTNGFNVLVQTVDQQDLADMKAMGSEVVRISLAQRALMRWKADGDGYGQFQDGEDYNFINSNGVVKYPDNFAKMHEAIQAAIDEGLKVIIDPHAVTGANQHYTMRETDPFWQDPVHKDNWVRLWKRVAQEIKDANYGDAIWAFDLMNEPASSEGALNRGGIVDLNDTYKELATEIHQILPSVDLILEFVERDFANGYVKAPSFYSSNREDQLIFGPHMYWQLEYTHQVRNDNNLAYPDLDKEFTYFDMLHGEGHWQDVIDYKNDHNTRIFIGEVGVEAGPDAGWDTNDENNPNPAGGGDIWYKDVIEMFEANGFDYTFHSYNTPQPGFDHNNSHAARKALTIEMLNGSYVDRLPPTPPTPSGAYIAFDSFEDWRTNGPFTGAEGWRSAIWTTVEDNGFLPVVSSIDSTDGDLSAKIIRASSITRTIDLGSVENVTINFDHRTGGLNDENDEGQDLEVFVNSGSGDVLVYTGTRGDSFQSATINLNDFIGNGLEYRNNTSITFKGNGNGATEFYAIDNVVIRTNGTNTPPPSGDSDVLAGDTFDDNTFAGGEGAWASTEWSIDEDEPVIANGGTTETAGQAKELKLVRKDTVSRAIDYGSATNVSLRFARRVHSLESTDAAFVQINATGNESDWVNLFSYDANSEQSATDYVIETVDISSYKSSNTILRFKSVSSGKGDYLYVDDIQIIDLDADSSEGGSSEPLPIPANYQAENRTSQSQTQIGSATPGFSGTGYVDMSSGAGAFIEWNDVNVGEGVYKLRVFFANGDAIDETRPCELTVNGVSYGDYSCVSRTGALDWKNQNKRDIPLNAGDNTIRLTATTDVGGPLIDELFILEN